MGILLRKVSAFKEIFHNEQRFLGWMIGIFSAIPLVYALYLALLTTVSSASIQVLLMDNAAEAINMIANLLCLYAGYTVYQIKKNPDAKESKAAAVILLTAQVLVMNMVTLVLCSYYIYHFSKFPSFFSELKTSRGIRFNKAVLMAVLVLFVSTVICILKIRLNILT